MSICSAGIEQTIKKSLEYVTFNDEISIYRWEVQLQSSPEKPYTQIVCYEGYARTASVVQIAENLQENLGVSCPVVELPDGVCLMPPALVEQASAFHFHQIYGFSPKNARSSRRESKGNAVAQELSDWKERTKLPYTWFTGLSLEEKKQLKLFFIDYGNYRAYEFGESLNSPLKPIRHPIHYEYIHNNVDNATYDLKKLADYLFNHPAVTLTGSPLCSKAAIKPIPSYNAEQGRNAFIPFDALLSHEDYRKACVEAFGTLTLNEKGEVKSSKKMYATVEDLGSSVEKLDILGMNAFKISKKD